jgi:hypothetical protein
MHTLRAERRYTHHLLTPPPRGRSAIGRKSDVFSRRIGDPSPDTREILVNSECPRNSSIPLLLTTTICTALYRTVPSNDQKCLLAF